MLADEMPLLGKARFVALEKRERLKGEIGNERI